MTSIAGLTSRLRTLRMHLCPPPKREVWLPKPLCLREENGEYYYADEEAEAIDARCEKLGITPNVYVVDDEWNPDMDGIDND